MSAGKAERSGGPVVLMVDGPFPDRLERRRAARATAGSSVTSWPGGCRRRRSNRSGPGGRRRPRSVAGQREVGRAPPGQPAHLLSGAMFIESVTSYSNRMYGVTGLGDDARPAHHDPARQRTSPGCQSASRWVRSCGGRPARR
jgi:hypothetical protein